MNLQEIKNEIRSKGYLFEIAINGKAYPRTSIEEIKEKFNQEFEYWLDELIRLNNAQQLGFQLYAKNGSSYLKKAFVLVQVAPTEPKVETNPVEGLLGVGGFPYPPYPRNNFPSAPQSPAPIVHQAVVSNSNAEVEILKVKLEIVNERLAEVKKTNQALEATNQRLLDENIGLIREQGVYKDKIDLEYQRKEIERANEKASGLSGIMNEVQQMPPDTIRAIVGMINPKHPMFNQSESSGLSGVDLPKHDNPQVQEALDFVYKALYEMEGEKLGMVITVFQKLLMDETFLNKSFEVARPKELTP